MRSIRPPRLSPPVEVSSRHNSRLTKRPRARGGRTSGPTISKQQTNKIPIQLVPSSKSAIRTPPKGRPVPTDGDRALTSP